LTEFFEGSVGSGTFAPRRKVTHKSKRMTQAMANLRRRADSDDDVQEIFPRQMDSKRKRHAADVVKIESESDRETSQKETEEESSSGDDNYDRMRGNSVAPKKHTRKATPKGKRDTRRKRLKA